MMGALRVEIAAGVRFEIGTGFSDAVRRDPPPVGTLITFQYRELTKDGVPRFASYLRRREASERPGARHRGRGFIGRRLVSALRADGCRVRVLTRGKPAGAEEFCGDLADPAALDAACAGVTTVFHCAGHAHAFGALSEADEARHWQVNFEGTRALAEAAGRAGVRCFVFLSSVKAMGEPGDACIDEDWRRCRHSQPRPRQAGCRRRAAGGRRALCHAGHQSAPGHGVWRRWSRQPGTDGGARSAGPLSAVAGNRQPALAGACGGRGGRDAPGVRRCPRGWADLHRGPSGHSFRARLYDALRVVLGLAPVGWAVPRVALAVLARAGDLIESP